MEMLKLIISILYQYKELISLILFFISAYQLLSLSKKFKASEPLVNFKNLCIVFSMYLKTTVACFAIGYPDLEYVLRFLTIGILIGLPLIDLLKIKHGLLKI